MQQPSSFAEISFNNVRDNIRLELGLEDTSAINRYLSLQIVAAHRRIFTASNVTQKSITLDVCDFEVELPCDYKEFIALALYPCANTLQPLVYTDYPFDAPQGVLRNTWANRYRIEHNVIKFPSNFENQQVELFYEAYRTEDNGVPILSYQHQDYYLFYVASRHYRRLGNLNMANDYKNDMVRTKRALVHNEQVVNWNLDKQNIRNILRVVAPNINGWYANVYYPNIAL